MNISVGYPKKYKNVTLEKYIIMPNHIHLIILIDSFGTGNPSPTVSSIIAWLKYNITRDINYTSHSPGNKVFQRSFYDHVIRDYDDFLIKWQYIDNNPKKWLLGKDEYYYNSF